MTTVAWNSEEDEGRYYQLKAASPTVNNKLDACKVLHEGLNISISGFIEKDKAATVTEIDRKYGTLGHRPSKHPPAYHILPSSSYLIIPQDSQDLLGWGISWKPEIKFLCSFLSDTEIQSDTAQYFIQFMDKTNMDDIDKEDKKDKANQEDLVDQEDQKDQEEQEGDLYKSTKF